MTTKVKPTVEKWERIDVENLAYQIVYKIGDEIIPTGVGTLTSKRLAEEIEPILTKAISLSVQEAKAEERERLRDRCEDLKWDVKGVDNGYWWTRGEQVSKIDVYQEAMSDIQAELSALNTKASLKQEEVQDEK